MILRTDNLVKKYKSRTVAKNVTVEVKQGEIVGLLGPNGAGKTTSFYMIVGMVKPNSGKIFLDDKDITDEPMYKRAQLGIGYLPQEASVFRKLSVEDNIKAILEMTKLSKEQQSEKLEELLNEFLEVISRPKLRKYFNDIDLTKLLSGLENHAVYIKVKSNVTVCRDKKDNFLLALSEDGKADFLLTGD